MKRKCFTSLMAMVSLASCLIALNARSQTANGMLYSDDYVHQLGIGFQLGAPIGVNAKYWLNENWAVDGAFGLSTHSDAPVEIHADFLVHDFDLFNPSAGKMPFYVGGGLVGVFRDHGAGDMGGFRFPIGVTYMFENMPIDIFAEVAPEIMVTPFRRGYLSGAVGVRFWF